MLCLEEHDESEVLTGVGPGIPPLSQCVAGCCNRPVRLQIRTRYGAGYALMCAAFQNPETEAYHTELTTVVVYNAYNSDPEPDELVRSCQRTTVQNTGPSAYVSWGGTDATPDCDGVPSDTTEDPEGCMASLLDEPADYSSAEEPVLTYGGASTTEAGVKAAAIGAFDWGEWSEWTDLVAADAYAGSEEGGYLSHYLAGASRGAEGPPLLASVAQYESELRIIGGSPLHLAIGEGTGMLSELPIARYTLYPGTPQLFSSSMPTWAEGWVSTDKVLRCVCPVKFAPTA
jgi:hypothetical protein